MRPVQATLDGIVEAPRVEEIVDVVTDDSRRPYHFHSANRGHFQNGRSRSFRGFRPQEP